MPATSDFVSAGMKGVPRFDGDSLVTIASNERMIRAPAQFCQGAKRSTGEFVKYNSQINVLVVCEALRVGRGCSKGTDRGDVPY